MFGKIVDYFLGKKVEKTRIIPLSTKIVFVFGIFLLISNFTTNYINLSMNQNLLEKYLKIILIKDLKEIIQIANNQYEIYAYTDDFEEAVKSLKLSIEKLFPGEFSLTFALFNEERDKLVFSTKDDFELNQEILTSMDVDNFSKDSVTEFSFNYANDRYVGVYHYHREFDIYFIRAEEENSYKSETELASFLVSTIIIVITIICCFLGFLFINRLTNYLKLITDRLMEMQEKKRLDLIDLTGASNDQVTYLGVVLNSLSLTMKNLLEVFRKFVSNDLVQKAYRERIIRLEGEKRELSVLFTDIKKFTLMTETLGNDVIKLLNLFYNESIESILDRDGIIGSIIGDALLAIYGALDGDKNKSYQAIISGFKIIEDAEKLRSIMIERKRELMAENPESWTEDNERIFRAVMLDVGVGIDGGEVFYGNIGSNRQMTNTVIGDNVNSASRLEGLTREYGVSMICSEYVKNDVEQNMPDSGIYFLEIDRVIVKGKTRAKTIYTPILEKDLSEILVNEVKSYQEGLSYYYHGSWKKANLIFKDLEHLEVSKVMETRTRQRPPSDWRGGWLMKKK